jgi:hypothetical protein
MSAPTTQAIDASTDGEPLSSGRVDIKKADDIKKLAKSLALGAKDRYPRCACRAKVPV